MIFFNNFKTKVRNSTTTAAQVLFFDTLFDRALKDRTLKSCFKKTGGFDFLVKDISEATTYTVKKNQYEWQLPLCEITKTSSVLNDYVLSARFEMTSHTVDVVDVCLVGNGHCLFRESLNFEKIGLFEDRLNGFCYHVINNVLSLMSALLSNIETLNNKVVNFYKKYCLIFKDVFLEDSNPQTENTGLIQLLGYTGEKPTCTDSVEQRGFLFKEKDLYFDVTLKVHGSDCGILIKDYLTFELNCGVFIGEGEKLCRVAFYREHEQKTSLVESLQKFVHMQMSLIIP